MTEQVVYEGRIDVETNPAQKNVQDLERKISKIDGASSKSASGVDTLSKSVGNSTQAIGGLKLGATAVSQLMRGDFVGAMASGAGAVKALQTAFTGATAMATGIVSIIAVLATAAFMYYDNQRKKAAQVRKDMEDFAKWKKDFDANISKRENGDVVAKKVDNTDSIEAIEAEIKKAEKLYQIYKQVEAIEMGAKEGYAKNGNLDKFDSSNLDSATANAEEAQRVVDLWKGKLNEIADARKELSDKNLEDEKRKIDELAEYENKVAEDVAEMKAKFASRRAIDKEADPIKKLQLEKKDLGRQFDNIRDGEDAEIKRQEIIEKIYEVEKRIAEEKKKASEASKTASEQEAKAKAEDFSASAGESEESEDKPKTAKPTIRRMGSSRSASGWFKSQMEARREASGISRLTYDSDSKKWLTKQEMKEKKDAKGKNKTEEATIASEGHLKKIAEVLAGA